MGHNRNTIPHNEYMDRMNALMPILIEKGSRNKQDVTELFFLYNDRLTPRENKPECGGCRKRVFERMKRYYSELNANTNS